MPRTSSETAQRLGHLRKAQQPEALADDALVNPRFNDSDTALRGSAFLQSEAKPQVVSAAKDSFRKHDDVATTNHAAIHQQHGFETVRSL